MSHGKSWAVITGASSGLGVEIAKQLAERKINVVLTARPEQQLEQTAQVISRDHGVDVVVEPLDLSVPELDLGYTSRFWTATLHVFARSCNSIS